MLNLFGQFGPLVDTRLYLESDKPDYVKGVAVCSVSMFLVSLQAWWLRRRLIKENERCTELGITNKNDEDEVLVDENGLRTEAPLKEIV